MISNTIANPFVGLRPFESNEDYLFFGRESQTLELLQRLHKYHFVAVIGSSGSGKSSLIKAGLIPALEAGYLVNDRDRWLVASMKPGLDPLYNLASVILDQQVNKKDGLTPSAVVEKIKGEGVDALVDIIKLMLKDNTSLFLLVDQFEELFRFSLDQKEVKNKDEPTDFVNLLLELARQKELPIYVVITMRSDFIGDCSQFFGLPEALNQSQYLVPRLTRTQLETTIIGPVSLYGVKISAGLTARLLNDVQLVKDELPLLQHALMRTWDFKRNESKNGELNIDDYLNVGGIEKALSNHADEALSGISEDELLLTKKMFQALTTIDDNGRKVRRPVRLGELEAITGAGMQQLLPLIHRFIEGNRSFITINKSGEERDWLIDISHESLIRQWGALSNWVDEEAASGKAFMRLNESARLYEEKKKDLLSGNELNQLLEWYHSFKPGSEWARQYSSDYEKNFHYLQQSEIDARRKKNKAKLNLIAIITVLTIFIVALAFAYLKANKAEKLAITQKEANANQLARNYWITGQRVGAENDVLSYLHYAAEAAVTSKDTNLTQTILLDIDSYLPIVTLKKIISNHNYVESAVFSPDGKLMATTNEDSAAYIWNIQTGKQAAPALKHQGFISTLVFSRNGKTVLTASMDSTVRLWDVATGKQIGEAIKHEESVTTAAFSFDEKLVVTTCMDSTARIWDLQTRKQVVEPIRHKGLVDNAAFSSDGKSILTLVRYQPPQLWNVSNGKEILPSKKNGIVARNAVLSPDGKYILIGNENEARLLEVATGRATDTVMHGLRTVNSAAFSADGQQVLVTSNAGIAGLLDLKSGGTFINLKHDGDVKVGVFSPDGKLVLTGTSKGIVQLWSTTTGQPVGPAIRQREPVKSLSFSSDGKKFIALSTTGIIRVCQLEMNASHNLDIKQGMDFRNAVFTNDGKRILVASASSLVFWDALQGTKLGPVLSVKESNIRRAILSPDNSRILTTHDDNTANVWEAKTGNKIFTIKFPDIINVATFSPDGKQILTACGKAVTSWDAATGKSTGIVMNHSGVVSNAIYSPDGHTVLTTCYENDSVWRWHANSGKDEEILLTLDDVVYSVAFSPDGKKIVTAGKDKTARVWRALTGQPVDAVMHHDAEVSHASYSSDGKRILTVTNQYDNNLFLARVWEAGTGRRISTDTRLPKAVTDAVFSPDGHQFLVGGLWGNLLVSRLSADLDIPPDLFQLQVRVTTGSLLEIETNEIWLMSAGLWHRLEKEYNEEASEHFKHCRYPQYNFWNRFYKKNAF